MKDDKNLQHVQLPNSMTNKLKPQDLVIYLTIKRHMNNETKQAFPSLQKICQESGASINTVRKCIKNLIEADYIEIIKDKNDKRKNIYHFKKWEQFEPFSYEFLDNDKLTFTEKAYLAASQQYMFKDVEGIGKVTFSNKELSSLINMPEKTIYACDKALEKKNLLNVVKTEKVDDETGLKQREKIYNLSEVEQGIIWVLKNHEDRIQQNTDDIIMLKEQIESLNKTVKALLKENTELKKTEDYTYTM